jgi:hypothetical protein
MGTLTVGGIKWNALRYCERLAFGFLKHAIVYCPSTGFYHLKESGETVFADRSVAVCLEHATEYVWDYYARQIKPIWEMP